MPLQDITNIVPTKNAGLQSMNRDQELARVLANQALQPLKHGRMVGKHFVGTHPAEGAAKLGQAALSVYANINADNKREAMQEEEQQNIAKALEEYNRHGGSPEVAPSGDKNSIWTGEMPYDPGRPEVPANREAQASALVNSRVPFLQKIGVEQMFPEPGEAYTLSAGAQRRGPNNQVVASNPKPEAKEKTSNYGLLVNEQAKYPQGSEMWNKYQAQIDQENYIRPPSTTTVNTYVGPTGKELTVGEEKVDKDYAKDLLAWKQGGFSDAQKSVAQLREAAEALRTDPSLTGPGKGLIPDAVRAVTNPDAVNIQEKITEIVQRNLRIILGAQFTEKEGERLISRAFNPNLPTEMNYQRAQKLIKQISLAAQAKQEAAEYWEQHGTLQGWKGKEMTKADFDPDILFNTASEGKIKEADDLPPGFKED